MCECWELLLPTISSKLLFFSFFEQAADSSLDYYLDFLSFTEHHLPFVLSVLYSSFYGTLFSLLALHNHLSWVRLEVRGTVSSLIFTFSFTSFIFSLFLTSPLCESHTLIS